MKRVAAIIQRSDTVNSEVVMVDLWNRCDECGRLIAFEDFANGKAIHRLLEPDSDLGSEEWETLCPKHASDHADGGT